MGKTKRLTVPAAALDNADGPGGEAVVQVPDKKKMPTRVRVQCNECGAVRGSEPPSKILVQFGTDEQGKPRYYEYSRTRIGKTVQYKPADTMEFVRIDSGRVTADRRDRLLRASAAGGGPPPPHRPRAGDCSGGVRRARSRTGPAGLHGGGGRVADGRRADGEYKCSDSATRWTFHRGSKLHDVHAAEGQELHGARSSADCG